MAVGVVVFNGVLDEVGGMSVGSGTGGWGLDLDEGIELWKGEVVWDERGFGDGVGFMGLSGLELVLIRQK